MKTSQAKKTRQGAGSQPLAQAGNDRLPASAGAASAPGARTVRHITTSLQPTGVAAPRDAAARSRIQQRRRQRAVRHLRHFEMLLPGLPGLPGASRLSLPGRLPQARLALPPAGWLRQRWLWISVLALGVLVALVAWAHLDDRWYIYRENAHFYGLTYLNADDLWQQSQLDGWNVFWIDGGAVRDRLLQNPYVADAKVQVSPLEAAVRVQVTEARPVALWTTASGTHWVLPSGRAVDPIGTTPAGLLTVLDTSSDATAPGAATGSAIDVAVLASAEGLRSRLPGVNNLYYNRDVGLNFRLPDKQYWIYWGDGADVDRKLENLAAGEQLVTAGDIKGEIIDVRFQRPYIK